MMFVNRPASTTKIYTKQYNGFRGVDMTSAVTEIDDSRSPDGLNMIALMDGFPQKRTGYEQVANLPGRIHGLHVYGSTVIAHSGDRLYAFDGTDATEIYVGMSPSRSVGFIADSKLYILDGTNYLRWDGISIATVESVAKIPTTTIAASPSGGGTKYEDRNLLQPTFINSFMVGAGDASATVFQLDTQAIDGVTKCEKLDNNGTWVDIVGYTVDTATGKVTFTVAPGATPVTGEDNVRITATKTIGGYANRIKYCTIRTFYGIGSDLRVFVSGNRSYPEYDWASGSNDPTYFPDVGYSIVGSEVGAIMGYMKQYEDLIIVKQPNDQDACLFSRTATMDSNNKAVFTVRQGIAGVGAVSKYAFGVLADDNLFLTREGVFGLDASNIVRQKSTQLRSYYINKPLMEEPDLEETFAIVHKGYYYLFSNDKAYVADSKQRNKNPADSFGYEWYYWENIPARCACVYNDRLLLGGSNGVLYWWKDEVTDGMKAYSDDGGEIPARWTTKVDALGDPSTVKRIMKNNTGVTVMPFAKSSGEISFITDKVRDAKTYSMSTTLDLNHIDLNHLGLGKIAKPYFVPARKKVRNAKMFQLQVENNELDEGFGVYGFTVSYAPTKAIKR